MSTPRLSEEQLAALSKSRVLDALMDAFRSAQAEAAALRVDRDECLRLLSEERRAKGHAETEAAVLRAQLETARGLFERFCNCCGSFVEADDILNDLRSALEES